MYRCKQAKQIECREEGGTGNIAVGLIRRLSVWKVETGQFGRGKEEDYDIIVRPLLLDRS